MAEFIIRKEVENISEICPKIVKSIKEFQKVKFGKKTDVDPFEDESKSKNH